MCFLTICDALWHTSQIEKTKDNREDTTDLVVDWINQSAFHVFHENRYLSIKYWSISLLFKGSFVQTEGLQPLGHPAHSRLYRRVRRAGRERLWENTLIFINSQTLQNILIFVLQMLNSQCRAGVWSEMFHQGRLARKETEEGRDEIMIFHWEG